MKFYGDIPQHHKELVKELQELEEQLNYYLPIGDLCDYAKGMTCLASDYASMDMEEESIRLINIAEKAYPGYFKKKIYDHAKEDRDYLTLILSIKNPIALEHMRNLGFNNE